MSADSRRARHIWLDAARGLTIFGVILLHVVLMFGAETVAWYIRIRDFAFPVIVLSSFYTLTISVGAGSAGFLSGFRRRAERLLAPAMIWTLAYWYGWGPMVSVFTGSPITLAPLPVWHLLAGGFMHLWYLMFLFYSSTAILGLLHASRHFALDRWVRQPWVWLALAAGYLAWVRDPLVELVAPLGQPGLASWFTFKRQSLLLATYIPVGVALGLMAGRLAGIGQRPLVRHGVVGLAAAIAVPYTLGLAWPYARECFSLAVFLALLMPWRPPPYTVWPRPASESYAVYILHYGIAQALVLGLLHLGVRAGFGVILATAIATYAVALFVAVAGRRLPLFSRLLPRIPVSPGAATPQTSRGSS